jgi:hypothetical protein
MRKLLPNILAENIWNKGNKHLYQSMAMLGCPYSRIALAELKAER